MFFRLVKLAFLITIQSFSVEKPMCRRRLMNSATMFTTGLSVPLSTKAEGETLTAKSNFLEPLSVYMYGQVTDESCMQLTMVLHDLDKKAQQQRVLYPDLKPKIELHIQSGGGALMPTFYVCDTIKLIETPVHVYVDGFAASAASLMSVCGNKRIMTKNSAMLVHQLTGATSGKFNEIKDEMTNLNFFMNKVKNIYLENTKLNSSVLDDLLSSDIWLDAQTCLEYGLVDEII